MAVLAKPSIADGEGILCTPREIRREKISPWGSGKQCSLAFNNINIRVILFYRVTLVERLFRIEEIVSSVGPGCPISAMMTVGI